MLHVTFVHISVSESVLLRELLERYIHPTRSDPIVRHQLSVYVASSPDVEVVMEDEAHRSVSSS